MVVTRARSAHTCSFFCRCNSDSRGEWAGKRVERGREPQAASSSAGDYDGNQRLREAAALQVNVNVFNPSSGAATPGPTRQRTT